MAFIGNGKENGAAVASIGNYPKLKGYVAKALYSPSSSTFTVLTHSPGNCELFRNGVKLIQGEDFTDTETTITLNFTPAASDIFELLVYLTFEVANAVTTGSFQALQNEVTATKTRVTTLENKPRINLVSLFLGSL